MNFNFVKEVFIREEGIMRGTISQMILVMLEGYEKDI